MIGAFRTHHVGTCQATGKRQFTDRKRARVAAKATARGLSVYRCIACDLWHIGSKRGLSREQHREIHRHEEES